jgi:hypothetical protein
VANQHQPDAEAGKLSVPEHASGISAKGAARRRFAKAGIGASGGVLLTLASQPAMAATLVCTSPSGAISGNLSRHDTAVACEGLSPGFWKTHHEAWQGALTNGDAKFHRTFPTTSRCAALDAYTCFDIVDPDKVVNGADPNNVAMHIMATLLNVRSKRIGFLNENQVMGIWNSYALNGVYKPTSTVTWGGSQIVAYLTSTMS